VYREESRRVLATLIRLLGDLDRAEDALQDAFRAAAEQWPRDGVPQNPRIVRAKSRICDERIPYEVPSLHELPKRLNTVVQVVYLILNEGNTASQGESLMRLDLTAEAIRLGRLLVERMPGEAEVAGLLALMLLHESRKHARSNANGNMILIEHQDRRLWDRAMIDAAVRLSERALSVDDPGPYALQAALTAVHAQAATFAETDWSRLVTLYEQLYERIPSAVIALNRAVALAQRDGPAAGLDEIDAIFASGELTRNHLAHSARAALLVRLQRFPEARALA
jgi:RNA polymerase sigma-70 factor (ECF subfamily)